MKPQLTKAEAERYAPYHTFPAFAQGFSDWTTRSAASKYQDGGVNEQAYDRGMECAMRRSVTQR